MTKKILIFFMFSVVTAFFMGQYMAADYVDTAASELTEVIDSNYSENYVCPMHSEIISNHEKNCPICGMKLVKTKANFDYNQYSNQNHRHNELDQSGLPTIEIASSVVHNLGISAATVERGELVRNIETIGKITRVDPMARRTITPPIRGELVYVAEKYQGDMVERGELLFTITSKKLIDMQNTYQQAFNAGDRATATGMIPELSKMGLSLEQLGKLQEEEQPMAVNVYAFEDGFVYTRRGKVGESVHTGFTVFNVGGNYQVIEVTAEIFERQWSWVSEGQSAKMSVRGLPGITFEGKVVRVEPPVGYTTRSLEVALKFRTNNQQLSQSMFAHISIEGQAKHHVLLVPTDTVIKTGQGDRVVLMLGENKFKPVEVVAGEESNGMIEIRSGLNEGDKVVSSGQFLIDSESNLQAELKRMLPPVVEDIYEHQENSKIQPKFTLAPNQKNIQD